MHAASILISLTSLETFLEKSEGSDLDEKLKRKLVPLHHHINQFYVCNYLNLSVSGPCNAMNPISSIYLCNALYLSIFLLKL